MVSLRAQLGTRHTTLDHGAVILFEQILHQPSCMFNAAGAVTWLPLARVQTCSLHSLLVWAFSELAHVSPVCREVHVVL